MIHIKSLLILLVLCFVHVHSENVTDPEFIGEPWDVNHQKGIMKGQNLALRRIKHPTNRWHSCYRATCTGPHCTLNHKEHSVQTRDFCYPAVVVTGLPKCGTSAMFELLSKFPGAIVPHEKENCPYTRRRAHFLYFHSLPRFEDIKENSLAIDGCIDVINNMKMRDMLRGVDTYYIVMIRDFADMLWSSYNFWCKVGYDKDGCPYERYANKQFHTRSPEIFHELVIADMMGNTSVTQPFYYPMHRPCVNAGGYFTEYIDFHVLRYVKPDHTFVIASEELDVYPMKIAQRIATQIGYNITGMQLGDFNKVRVNAQDNKGGSKHIPLAHYIPGVYNISDYRPMLNNTREILYNCWKSDCLAIEKRFHYNYSACHSSHTKHNIKRNAQEKLHLNHALTDLSMIRRASDMSTSEDKLHDLLEKANAMNANMEKIVRSMVIQHSLDRLNLEFLRHL